MATRAAIPISDALAENRQTPRIKRSIPAQLRPSCSRNFAVTVFDISLAGFACDAVTGMHIDSLCWLTLPKLSGLEAKIIWNDGATVGCCFTNRLHPAVLDRLLARHY